MGYTAAQAHIWRNAAGSSLLYFRPGHLVYQGGAYDSNQAVTNCESGRVVVAQPTTNDVRFLEFAVQQMPYGTESATLTMSGWSALESFIRTVAVYRANVFYVKLAGVTNTYPTLFHAVRFWDATLPFGESGVPVVSSAESRALASGKIILRVEVS